MANLTIREVCERYGTTTRLNEWLKSLQMIELICTAQLKNAKAESEVVSRELVQTGIIDPVEAAHHKILTDGVKTIVDTVIIEYKAESTVPEIESKVADILSSFIRTMKTKVRRSMKKVIDGRAA